MTSLKLLRFLHRYSFEIAVTVLAGPFVFAALGQIGRAHV